MSVFRLYYLITILICSIVSVALANPKHPPHHSSAPPPTIKLGPPGSGFTIASADDRNTLQVFGYAQVYAVKFTGDTRDTVNQTSNLDNGVVIPLARLFVAGRYLERWAYRFSYDFAQSRIRHTYIRYHGVNHIEFTLGQYKPSFSLGYLNSRRNLTFIERALPVNAFIADYVIGGQLFAYGKHATFAAGIFGPNSTGVIQGHTVSGSDPLGANVRFTYSPWHYNRHSLHFGLGGYYRQADGANISRFRAIPEIRSRNKVFLVDTGNINNSNHYNVANIELAGVSGPLYGQAEYYLTKVSRNGGSRLDFSGYYLQGGYFLTGESRPYNFKAGNFGGVSHINHRYGAWEVAARFSRVDLQDSAITGGVEKNYTIGVNWYPVKRFKFAFNFIHANARPSNNGRNRQTNAVAIFLQTLI